MLNLSVPTSLISLAKAANSNLDVLAKESLNKAQHRAKTSEHDLRIWSELQDDKLNQRINTHINRPQLKDIEAAAVNAWLDIKPADAPK